MSHDPQPTGAVEVFYSYAHVPDDEKLKNELLKQLSGIERQGVIVSWHDRKITAGREWAGEIDKHINTAGVILLLVSPDFMASGYCNDVELERAMERHEAGEALVVPIILRPTLWTGAPFEKLQMLPTDARAVTLWPNRDEALLVVAQGIHKAVRELAGQTAMREPKRTSEANIPRPPFIGFVARRDEQGRDIVALLEQQLAPDKSGLIAIWGVGGTGKTTLAAEVARALRGDFPQRLAWVSALGRTDFGLPTLLDDIATQLGRADLRRLAPDPKAEQVSALLADLPSLVVLDNFETIEPGEQARCVNFLATGTGCSALITTRERVNHADVRNARLAAMAMDDAREFWRRMIEQSGRPEAFDGLNADEIIRQCEANPLVIQWVVGQIEQAQRPQDALAYLSQGHGDAAERVFDRSFNLPQLGDDGRAALLALSLFTPDASRESLAEVAGFGDDLNRLNEAVRRMSALWLVEATEGNERLFLRALKHEMAKSRLSKDAHAADFRRRYIEHFLRYAQTHAQPTPEGLDALDAERDNLRAAQNMAFGSRDFESVIRAADKLSSFLSLRGYWDEAIRSGEQAEEAARQLNNDWDTVAAMALVASIRIGRGEYKKAEITYRKAVEVFKGMGSEKNVAASLHQLGVIAQQQGELERARQYYDESLEISKRLDNQNFIASTTSQIGILLLRQGDIEQSKAMHEECLAIRRTLGEHQGMAIDLNQLGRLARARNDFAEARRLFSESLEISRQLGAQVYIAVAFYNLGRLSEQEGDKTEAARLYRETLRIYETIGSPEADGVRDELKRVEGELD